MVLLLHAPCQRAVGAGGVPQEVPQDCGRGPGCLPASCFHSPLQENQYLAKGTTGLNRKDMHHLLGLRDEHSWILTNF